MSLKAYVNQVDVTKYNQFFSPIPSQVEVWETNILFSSVISLFVADSI